MSTNDSKTAEFARLFDLFERLASRKARTSNGESYINTLDDVRSSVPPDLAPVVHSLASLVGTRKNQGDARSKRAGGGRTRSNTVACSPKARGLDSEDEEEEALAKFPLGKIYPFTFKLMLHKLYQLDDWAEKVKKVLERSQIEYKPLAERELARELEEVEVKAQTDGRVHFKAGLVSGGARRPSVRPRSHSVMIPGKSRDIGTGAISPVSSPKSRDIGGEEIRAVKKRCVGRRKSMSGPISSEAGRVGGGWVYAASASSVESTERNVIGNQPQSKYQSLGGGRKVVGAARRVSLGSSNILGHQWGQPQREDRKIAARRRALSMMDNLGVNVVQRKPMKRPFEL